MTERAQQALQFFMDRGYSRTAAAGIVGRLGTESGLDPMVRPGDQGSAFGLAQWRFDRWNGMKDFAASQGKSEFDFETQLAYVDHELRTKETGAYQKLQTAGTVEDAVAAMMDYERPHGWSANNPRAGAGWGDSLTRANTVLGLQGLPMGAGGDQPQGTPIFNGTAPYADVPAPDTVTDEEIRRHRQENPSLTFWGAVETSAKTDWTSAWLVREMGGRAVDPAWGLDFKRFNEDTRGLPEDYHSYVANAHSEDDYVARLKTAHDDSERERQMAELGWSGTGIRLATSLFDPTMIAAAVGSDLMAAPAIAAAKVGRAGRILLEGLAVGTSNAAITAASGYVNPKIDTRDVVAAFGTGMFLGGVAGALRRNPATQDEARMMTAIGRQIEQHQNAAPGASSAGAASTGDRQFLMGDTPFIEQHDAPTAAFGSVRFDAGGQLGSSSSAVARTVAAHFGEEAVGFVGHDVVPDAATTVQRVIHGRYVRDWNTVAFPSFKKWAEERDLWGPIKKHRAWEQFNRDVADFVEDVAKPADVSPHVKAAASEFRRVMSEYAELLANPRRDRGGAARPLSEVGSDPFYLPKYADHESINTHLERFEWETLRKFVKQAVFAKRADIDPELADRIAEGWLRNITKAGYGMEDKASLAVAQADREMLKDAFKGTSLSDEELDAVLNQVDGLEKKTDGDSGYSRTRRRTLLDYTFGAEVRGRDGGLHRLSMQDFFMRDADFVLNRYSRQTSGRVALAQMEVRNPTTGELVLDGIRTPAEFEKLLDWVRDDWAKQPGKSYALKRDSADRDVQNLKYLWDAITGTPHYNPREAVYQWMRRAREFSFIRLMNNMGLNQGQEFARMFGSLGYKAVTQQVPALRRVVDAAGRSVSARDRLLQELEAATGKGLEMDFGRYRFRYEDELIGTRNYGRAGRAVYRALEHGKRLTADISLMTHITSIQKKWTMKAVSQRLYDMARKTRTDAGFVLDRLPGKELDKLRAIGMGDDDLKAVFSAMLDHSETPRGSKLAALNLDQWKPEVRARFINTMSRWTDRVIHENDAATLNRWMSQPITQMLTQFRAFIIGSWAKSTLYNLHNFDARTFATMMLEVMAGAASWAIAESGKDAFRPDKIGERLTTKNLIKAGFARASFGSIVPAVTDSFLSFTPIGPAFDFRTSGAATSFLFGSPVVDLYNDVAQFTSGVSDAAITGRPVSQREITSGARSLPFANWLPFAAALSWAIQDQPKTAPRDR